MTLTVAFISLLFSNCCFVRLFLSWLLKSSPLSISYFCILQLCLPCVSIWLCFYLSCLEFMFLESNHYYYLLSLENYPLFLTFPLFSLVSLKLVFDVWWDCQIFCLEERQTEVCDDMVIYFINFWHSMAMYTQTNSVKCYSIYVAYPICIYHFVRLLFLSKPALFPLKKCWT